MVIENILIGSAWPLGAKAYDGGVNFAIFSRHATRLSLLIFNHGSDHEPATEIELDCLHHRTGDIWHLFVQGLEVGAIYMYRVDGPHSSMDGHRFDWNKFLLDPYAKAITGDYEWQIENNILPKAIVIDDLFDWQGDRPLNYPLNEVIIYESHLKGLTALANVAHPGSYLGVIEQIPYLKELGITSIEFLPLFEFDELEYGHLNPLTGESVKNYWGYSTMAFFAPRYRYSSRDDAVNDFKTMVRALHKNGIEIILDVVFNHTIEGNENGPSINFKGIDNSIYYILYEDRRYYWNYSGCGNTVNSNHPIVINYILDCLRYWVMEMHVDGFRFDLASILCRDRKGDLLDHPPMIEMINEDPILRYTKMIAEPWDAGGAYQVGNFPGGRFAEWNDRYRDDVRRYWKNDPGMAPSLATRIGGSSDLYNHGGRSPYHSINYITAHDGFTLADLVSYNSKHNEANGEGNEDGSNNNLSYNCGVEGFTDDPEIKALRVRQMKNMILTLVLSQGVPMFLSGDEFGRSQGGNNNAYCQDNPTSWLDYRLIEENGDIFLFFKRAIQARRASKIFGRKEFYNGQSHGGSEFADINWYNAQGNSRDWHSNDNCLSCRISGEAVSTGCAVDDDDIAFFLNPTESERNFVIPPSRKGYNWYLKADTYESAPFDLHNKADEPAIPSQSVYRVRHHSSVVLVSKATVSS